MELYFYTHLESDFARKRVMALLDGRLFVTDPSRFNDPFDSQLDIYLDSNDKHLPIPESKEMQHRMICFSEKWDSLLMWGHYARCHKGICLKLNVDTESLPREKDILEPVRYSSHHPKIFTGALERGDAEVLRTYLLTKSVDWLYEKEWRFITSYFACERDGQSEPDYVKSSSFLQVEGVYLGVKFHDAMDSRNLWYRMQHRERTDHDTIFDLLEREDELGLSKLAVAIDGNVDVEKQAAIDRERVLWEFERRSIPVYGCMKKAGVFGLEHKPFEYNKLSSLMIGCFGKAKPGEIRTDWH